MPRKLIFLVLLFFTLGAYAQDSTFLSRAVNSAAAQPVQEKVYLHINQPAYYPGDTIWFKAYTVAGSQHKLSKISGVLYCELIGPRDSVLIRRVLKIAAGITWGDFGLPRDYKSGNYRIRAYTNWMRNAGPDYFFEERIRVLGPQTADLRFSGKKADIKPDIQFMPEGGGLVTGLRSKVAVKSINAAGLGQDISGIIIDNDGAEVASFTTQHLGMGVFALAPAAGKTYKARITAGDSVQFTVNLPVAIDKGFTLAVNNSGADSIFVRVAANAKQFAETPNAMFYLVAQANGKVYYTTQSKWAAPVFAASIPRARFPSGIIQFTLFSSTGEPLNERVIFNRVKDDRDIRLSSITEQNTARGKMKIGIDAGTDTGKVAIGSYSVSVINESRISQDVNDEVTILNDLLLTSDLRGLIEHPNYYFINQDVKTRADLDLLMLTQGYRSFEWKKVMAPDKSIISYQPETDLKLEGALKTPSGKILPKGKVTLFAPKDNFMLDTLTDINGVFRFTDLALSDTAKIVLRARKANDGSNVSIYVKQPDYPAVAKSTNVEASRPVLTPEMLKNIAEYREQQRQDSLKRSRVLKEVKISAKKTPKPDRFNGYGTAIERDLDMKRAHEYETVGEAIKYLAPHFRGGKIVIDGLELDSTSYFSYSWDEIQSVRLIEPNGFDLRTGRINTVGYIYITTKHLAGTDTTVLKEVKIVAKKSNKPDMSMSSNLHGGGNADRVLMGDDLQHYPNLSDCLPGKLIGIPYRQMSIIIDGVILDPSHIDDVDPGAIYSIEVLYHNFAKAIYGSSIEKAGALIITTRRGVDPKYATSMVPAGLITYPFKGFHKARVFYSPKYNHPKTGNEPFDSRIAIYWNPNILTDKDGKASFEYYNADTKGTYRIVVEGIDDDGKISRQVYRYEVK